MAQENTGGQPPPTPEQMDELLLVLNKEKMLLQAVSKADANGKLGAVPPTPEHNNDFLRLNGSDDWLESFVTNFWNQAKDPTRFSIIKIRQNDMDDPLVKKAMKDIEQGKITKNVVKFLEKYEVKPDKYQSINNQNQTKMAKKDEISNAPATSDELAPPRHRFNENMVDWKQIEAHGFTRQDLEQRGLYDQLMRGYKTNSLVPVNIKVDGKDVNFHARLQFLSEDNGRVYLRTHPLRQAPDLTRPFLGHNFSEDDKINLLESGHMGRVVPMKTRDDGFVDHFVSIDKLTNQITAARVDKAFIADEYSGIKLSDYEKQELKEGRAIEVKGMVSQKTGKEFDAVLQYNAETRRVEYDFPQSRTLKYGQEIGTVKLTNKQVDDYNAGKAIYVADMVRKRDGEVFDSFLKYDTVSGKMSYSRVNPDNPSEVLIPREIGGVKITPEEREQLSEGKAIFLNDMYSERRQEDFSSWVKIDMNSGYPMYSKTEHGFEEKREFKIPTEAFGVTFSAKQRADLQDGKAVLIEGMKGYGGAVFSQWAKVNQAGTKLNYYNENPDIKRDATSRNVAQTPAPKQDKIENKRKGRSQGV